MMGLMMNINAALDGKITMTKPKDENASDNG
jgi:hypothetical protein